MLVSEALYYYNEFCLKMQSLADDAQTFEKLVIFMDGVWSRKKIRRYMKGELRPVRVVLNRLNEGDVVHQLCLSLFNGRTPAETKKLLNQTTKTWREHQYSELEAGKGLYSNIYSDQKNLFHFSRE